MPVPKSLPLTLDSDCCCSSQPSYSKSVSSKRSRPYLRARGAHVAGAASVHDYVMARPTQTSHHVAPRMANAHRIVSSSDGLSWPAATSPRLSSTARVSVRLNTA